MGEDTKRLQVLLPEAFYRNIANERESVLGCLANGICKSGKVL